MLVGITWGVVTRLPVRKRVVRPDEWGDFLPAAEVTPDLI